MASLVLCEKCGKTSKVASDFMHIRAHKLKTSESYMRDTEKHMDVCKECYDKIFTQEGAENE